MRKLTVSLIFTLLASLLTAEVSFAADENPPVITKLSATNGRVQWWGNVGAGLSVTDDVGCCTSAQLELINASGSSVRSYTMRQLSTGGFAQNFGLKGDLLGTFTIRISVTDFSGKSASSDFGTIEIYQPDNWAPEVNAGINLTTSSVNLGGSFSINFRVTDDIECCTATSTALFTESGTQMLSGTTSKVSQASKIDSTYTAAYSIPSNFTPGTYQIRANATDMTGKVSPWEMGGAILGFLTVVDPTPTPTPTPTPEPTPTPTPTPTPEPTLTPTPSPAPVVTTPAPVVTTPVVPTPTPVVQTPAVTPTPTPTPNPAVTPIAIGDPVGAIGGTPTPTPVVTTTPSPTTSAPALIETALVAEKEKLAKDSAAVADLKATLDLELSKVASLRSKLDAELLEVAALRIKLEAELASATEDKAKAKTELETAVKMKQEADALSTNAKATSEAAAKVKQEAETLSTNAKAASDAAVKAKQEADAAKNAAGKVSTITCVNKAKKLTWQITSVAPKCPKGYVKK